MQFLIYHERDHVFDINLHDVPQAFIGAQGYFARILATASLRHASCVRLIDHDGQTLFNDLQRPLLLDEVEALATVAEDDEARAHLERLSALVRRASPLWTRLDLLLVPFASSGIADVDQIALRCAAHNRYEAER